MDLLKQAGDLLRVVAPALGTALGGPVGGLAAQAISNLLLGKPDGNQDELSTALLTATPDQLGKLKEIDNTFKVQMKTLDIDLERIASEDRDSARKREVEVKDWTPKVIGLSTIILFFFYVIVITFYPMFGIPIPLDKEIINLVLGALVGSATTVYTYYYGSSSGSDNKSKTIDRLTQ